MVPSPSTFAEQRSQQTAAAGESPGRASRTPATDTPAASKTTHRAPQAGHENSRLATSSSRRTGALRAGSPERSPVPGCLLPRGLYILSFGDVLGIDRPGSPRTVDARASLRGGTRGVGQIPGCERVRPAGGAVAGAEGFEQSARVGHHRSARFYSSRPGLASQPVSRPGRGSDRPSFPEFQMPGDAPRADRLVEVLIVAQGRHRDAAQRSFGA